MTGPVEPVEVPAGMAEQAQVDPPAETVEPVAPPAEPAEQ